MRSWSSRATGVAALAWLVAELSGCGAEVRGALAEEEFGPEFARGICSNMGACCASAGFAHEPGSCEATARQYFDSYVARRKTATIEYDGEAASRCLEAITKGLRACARFDSSDCERMFRGRVPVGQACATREECAAGEHERVRCEGGVCTLSESKAGTGDPCTGTCTMDGAVTDCSVSPPGQGVGFCYTNDGVQCGFEGRCVPIPRLGEDCGSLGTCEAGAFCDDTGTCSPQRDTGACRSSSDACGDRSYCDFELGECQPKKADGAACQGDEQCAGDSCNGGTCRPDIPVSADMCAGRFDDD